jgi:hypothetical protein
MREEGMLASRLMFMLYLLKIIRPRMRIRIMELHMKQMNERGVG